MIDTKSVRFKSAALRLMFDQCHVAMAGVIVAASAYTFVSWNVVDRSRLTIWLGLLFTASSLRYWIQLRWKRMLPNCTGAEMSHKILWLRWGLIISAMMWGYMGGVMVAPRNPEHLSITAFLLSGMAAGAVGAYAIQLRFMVLFVVILILPFAIRTGLEGMYLHSAVSASFMTLIALLGKNIHEQSLRSIELGLENEDLVHRLNDASHEIRTPVSAIVGFAEVLKDHETSAPSVREYANIIYRNSQYLKKLVDNILLLSRANSNLIDTTVEDTSLTDQIQMAVDVISKRVREKGLRFRVEIASDVPAIARINTLRLQQILINLLGNAVKFTDRGEIGLKVGIEGCGHCLVIRVKDTGIGISSEVRDLVFEPFWRENRVEVKRQEGSGLGLALSRSLAVGMGGSLRLVDSAPDKGSTFELRLPIVPVSDDMELIPNPEPKSSRHLIGKTVMVVDDCDDIRALYKLRLEQEGATVETCANGLGAVDMLTKSGKACDLVLMDINMPVMDGHSATSMLRRLGFSKPILALSAYSSPAEREKCLNSGFNDHVSKSLGVNRVVHVLESLA